MWKYITFEDLLNIYGISQEELSSIDAGCIRNQDTNGAEFLMDDEDGNGLPAFYDSYLGVDVDLKPSQGVAFG